MRDSDRSSQRYEIYVSENLLFIKYGLFYVVDALQQLCRNFILMRSINKKLILR